MGNLSGLTIGLSLIGLVLLIVLLIAILYKPAKRMHVACNFLPDSTEKHDVVLVVKMDNIGKRKLKLYSPYVRFSHATHSKLYQVKPETISCKFPYTLKIGEKMSCELDLGHFKSILEKQAFSPTHVKVIISDSAGLEFESASLAFKV